ncbi:hypothetical protein G6F31_021841 [Rhizopus arrhizus]|nr:hypothetical protein G6F31_021841 [Rhizopus arrhizus]
MPYSALPIPRAGIGKWHTLPMVWPEARVLRWPDAIRPDRPSAFPERAGNRLHHGGRQAFAHDAGFRQRTHPRHGRHLGGALAAA